MTVYHSTAVAAAEAIMVDGFRDARGAYLFVGFTLAGVFVASEPVDENDGATSSEVIIAIEVAKDAIAEYEIIDEHQRFREWCVLARILNAAPRRLHHDSDEKPLDAPAAKRH